MPDALYDVSHNTCKDEITLLTASSGNCSSIARARRVLSDPAIRVCPKRYAQSGDRSSLGAAWKTFRAVSSPERNKRKESLLVGVSRRWSSHVPARRAQTLERPRPHQRPRRTGHYDPHSINAWCRGGSARCLQRRGSSGGGSRASRPSASGCAPAHEIFDWSASIPIRCGARLSLCRRLTASLAPWHLIKINIRCWHLGILSQLWEAVPCQPLSC